MYTIQEKKDEVKRLAKLRLQLIRMDKKQADEYAYEISTIIDLLQQQIAGEKHFYTRKIEKYLKDNL